MKKTFKNIGLGIAFLLIGLFSIKSCVFTVLNFDNNGVYEKINASGQIDRIFIISSNDVVFSKNLEDTFELAHFHIRGEEATNYFGPIYNIGTLPFGLRIIEDAKNVFIAELELIDKMGNVSKTTFDDIGTKYESIIILNKESLKINDEFYKQIEFQKDELEKFKNIFFYKNR